MPGYVACVSNKDMTSSLEECLARIFILNSCEDCGLAVSERRDSGSSILGPSVRCCGNSTQLQRGTNVRWPSCSSSANRFDGKHALGGGAGSLVSLPSPCSQYNTFDQGLVSPKGVTREHAHLTGCDRSSSSSGLCSCEPALPKRIHPLSRLV